MTVFMDTSVLVAAFVARHDKHGRSKAAVLRVQKGLDQGFLAVHTLAELYATLTGMTRPSRQRPRTVEDVLRNNVFPYFRLLYLRPDDYKLTISRLVKADLPGGIIYDALIYQTATKIDFDLFLT
ncbi:MAG: PIN domain-containing protein, partial [Pedosphaera parvula]|nr:PIN domain-containing protein [Pedosphaera parvula]